MRSSKGARSKPSASKASSGRSAATASSRPLSVVAVVAASAWNCARFCAKVARRPSMIVLKFGGTGVVGEVATTSSACWRMRMCSAFAGSPGRPS
jgi:hypothetical protein